MPDENGPPPDSPPPDQPTLLGNLAPDELFARAMQTVKMTSGAAGMWQPPSIEEAAQLFPRYEVLKLLGRGGMGAVYQARQIELDRLVAIKLLPLEISVDKDFADRFRREARAMAKLHHPNIVTVFDFGTTPEGHLFFVMEFVEGANLQDVIHQAGLDPEQALSIVEQVCTALAYAHGKGIVHRDIKPANVMIDTESHVKVADFGLARLTDTGTEQLGHTMTGTVMGTPDYMAPEQMKGMNVDHRADIYSVGVMLYEMLCREVPKGFFQPPSQRTGCDARIDEIVMKAMHQAPDHRYQSTTEMKAEVIDARMPPVMVAASTQEVHPRPVERPALPEPQAAVMKAIPPPAAKKLKLPLLAGAPALLAVLGALFYFAPWKKHDANPVEKPLAVRPIPTPASSEGWTNLLASVDVRRDSLMAPWTMENGALRSPQRIVVENEDTPGSHQMFAFPIPNSPRNYDLRYRLTRNARGFAVVVPFARGKEGGDLRIDGGHEFRLLPRKGRDKQPKQKQDKLLLGVGEPHELLLEVREDRVRISLDGTVRVDHAGPLDGQRGDAFYPTARTRDPIIGIGVCGGDITIHSAEFREVDRDGKPVLPKPSASATKDVPFVNTLGMKFVRVPITGGSIAAQSALASREWIR